MTSKQTIDANILIFSLFFTVFLFSDMCNCYWYTFINVHALFHMYMCYICYVITRRRLQKFVKLVSYPFCLYEQITKNRLKIVILIRLWWTYIYFNIFYCKITVLINDALCLMFKSGDYIIIPPLFKITILVKLSTYVEKVIWLWLKWLTPSTIFQLYHDD